jgi:hypothetical protein
MVTMVLLKAGVHMRNAGRDILALFALDARAFSFCQFRSFSSISTLP